DANFAELVGLAWASDARELLLSVSDGNEHTRIVAAGVSAGATPREVLSGPNALRLYDVARNGRWLIATAMITGRLRLVNVDGASSRERDLSWLSMSFGARISKDGSVVAFNESSLGSPSNPYGTLAVRRTDGTGVRDLGAMNLLDLSPDGHWVV